MQRHGGEVRIESELGQGSRFRLVFPPARLRCPSAGMAASEGQEAPEHEAAPDSISA